MKRTLSYFCLATLMVAANVHAKLEKGCAIAKVVSGKSCSQLQIQFDLSQCESQSAAPVVSTQCEGDLALARLKTEQASYAARFKKGPEVWGESAWLPEGEVSFTPEIKSTSVVTRNKPPNAKTHVQQEAKSPPPPRPLSPIEKIMKSE